MGVRITVTCDFPAPVEKGVTGLGGDDGVHHDRQIATSGIFHADRDLDAAGGQADGDAAGVRGEWGEQGMPEHLQHGRGDAAGGNE